MVDVSCYRFQCSMRSAFNMTTKLHDIDYFKKIDSLNLLIIQQCTCSNQMTLQLRSYNYYRCRSTMLPTDGNTSKICVQQILNIADYENDDEVCIIGIYSNMGKLKHSVNTTCKHISVHVYTFFYDATYYAFIDFDLAVNVICIIALYFKNISIHICHGPH